jgi:hypothetical protein
MIEISRLRGRRARSRHTGAILQPAIAAFELFGSKGGNMKYFDR